MRSLLVSAALVLAAVVLGSASAYATPNESKQESAMLTLGMLGLGLATFAAMIGFVTLCDRV